MSKSEIDRKFDEIVAFAELEKFLVSQSVTMNRKFEGSSVGA